MSFRTPSASVDPAPAASSAAPREAAPVEGIDESMGCAALMAGSIVLGLLSGVADGLLPDASRMLRPLIYLALTLLAGTAWWVVRRAHYRRRARSLRRPVPPWRGSIVLLVCVSCFLFLSYTGIHQSRIRAAAAMPKQWPMLVRGGLQMSLVTQLAADTVTYRFTLHCAPAGPCPPGNIPAVGVMLYGPDGMEEEIWIGELESRDGRVAVARGDARMHVQNRSEYLAATCWAVEMSLPPYAWDQSPGCAPSR